jgi:hypothetical protein
MNTAMHISIQTMPIIFDKVTVNEKLNKKHHIAIISPENIHPKDIQTKMPTRRCRVQTQNHKS